MFIYLYAGKMLFQLQVQVSTGNRQIHGPWDGFFFKKASTSKTVIVMSENDKLSNNIKQNTFYPVTKGFYRFILIYSGLGLLLYHSLNVLELSIHTLMAPQYLLQLAGVQQDSFYNCMKRVFINLILISGGLVRQKELKGK